MHTLVYKKLYYNKKFGQNFLKDKKIVKKIINFINPSCLDILVEIGPGLGALTEPICRIVDNLVLVEIDKNVLYFLEKEKYFHKLLIFNQDVMSFNFEKLSIIKKSMLRIFGNLPYNISVKLILYLIKFSNYIIDMNFMVQKEVANRFIAQPGSKMYGRLSIIMQCYYDIKLGFDVGANAFSPTPKVQSTFLQLIPKKIPLYPYNKINFLKEITFLSFTNRRKILKNSLLHIVNKKIFLNLGIDIYLRPEDLSVIQYCHIAHIFYLYKNKC
ncbi:Ribosomal RNA small subunit methyltransferase A [Buchnera aphidicola (Pterocallis alni)]|uniref:16S rRNA (adenine(1518)-N(6)/adenine(1519)-N(6))- dimethyltransferase RsmA n=1 Tax=Buchnera aphidicola TaxID=9 RepID=UPI003464C509